MHGMHDVAFLRETPGIFAAQVPPDGRLPLIRLIGMDEASLGGVTMRFRSPS
jgi:hypothetical protein